MDVEQVALWMNPKPLPSRRRWDVFDLGDGDEVLGLDALNELADVDVNMALRLNRRAVVGHRPVVSEQRARLGDGGAPQFRAHARIEKIERAWMHSRQRQPAARLAGIDVLQEEYLRVRRLLLGLAAQAALARLQRLRTRWIAGASDEVGARGGGGQQGAEQ